MSNPLIGKPHVYKKGKILNLKPLDEGLCRCWICNEEGHYANACPNRKQNYENVKVLQQIIWEGLVAVEDPYEGYDNILVIEIDPGEETSDESTGSDESESEFD